MAVEIWSTKLKVNSTMGRKLLIKEDLAYIFNRLSHSRRIFIFVVKEKIFSTVFLNSYDFITDIIFITKNLFKYVNQAYH
jgi:hypothetical protein